MKYMSGLPLLRTSGYKQNTSIEELTHHSPEDPTGLKDYQDIINIKNDSYL